LAAIVDPDRMQRTEVAARFMQSPYHHHRSRRLADTICRVVARNASREARLMTDEVGHYRYMFRGFADHKTANHNHEEYVRAPVLPKAAFTPLFDRVQFPI
jgi:hypothetical protein